MDEPSQNWSPTDDDDVPAAPGPFQNSPAGPGPFQNVRRRWPSRSAVWAPAPRVDRWPGFGPRRAWWNHPATLFSSCCQQLLRLYGLKRALLWPRRATLSYSSRSVNFFFKCEFYSYRTYNQCCGSGSRIIIFPSRIPGQKGTKSRIRKREFKYFWPKILLQSSGSQIRIRNNVFNFKPVFRSALHKWRQKKLIIPILRVSETAIFSACVKCVCTESNKRDQHFIRKRNLFDLSGLGPSISF